MAWSINGAALDTSNDRPQSRQTCQINGTHKLDGLFVLLLYLSCTTPNLGIFNDDVSIKAQIPASSCHIMQ